VLAVPISDNMPAARSPPRSDPANSQFFLRADRALGGIVVDFDHAVVDEPAELSPARQRVADRFRRSGFSRQLGQHGFAPG
jgi:hypothetical protein